jgi:hypothetical protein
MRIGIKRIGSLAVAAGAALLGSSIARGDIILSNFTPGDLVVLRTGDATNPDTVANTAESAVYLDEYTTAGAYVGTVDVPSTGPNALTLPGTGDDQHQGALSISNSGTVVSFAGYNSAVGTADANADATIGKRIGVVGLSASSLDTTTVVNSYGAGSSNPYIRGAYTNDGAEFWTFGKYASSNATSNGGLAYVSGTGPSATTTTVEGFADWRDVIAVNGQLYGGTGSSSVGNHGPYQISSGEPTTNLGNSLGNNTQLGNYPGGQSASALALVNVPTTQTGVGSSNGLNVLYTIGDQSTPGIVKYYYNGSAWVTANLNVSLNAANNVLNPTGLVAVADSTNPNWVDLVVSGTNGVYTYVDTGGPTGAIPSNAFTDLISVPTNEQFRGVSLTPTSVPEPASLSLLGLGAASLLGRRRRRA